MPRLNTPQLNASLRTVNTGQVRGFVQLDPNPTSTYEYYGRMNLTDSFGQSRPESDVTELPSDVRRNEWLKIGEISRSLERGSSSFTQLVDQDLSTIWDEILVGNRAFNLSVLVGDSESPQDFGQWRSGYLLANCRVTDIQRGDNINPQSASENANMAINGSFNFWNVYAFGTVGFSDVAGTTVTRDLLDVVAQVSSNGAYTEVFAVTANTASTSPSAVVYVRSDKFDNITQTNVSSLSTDGVASIIAIAGDYVLLAQTDAANPSHLYSTLANVRQGNDEFTKITTGWVANKPATDVYVLNSANIFFSGIGGYIYKLNNVTGGVTVLSAGTITTQNLAAIDGFGSQVVAVGAADTILYSDNLGSSFQAANTPASGDSFTAVSVVGRNQWFVGAADGGFWFTEDAGVNWTALSLPGSPSTIHGIEFYGRDADSYFGFLIADDGSDVQIYRTVDSGNTWNNTTPHVARVASTFSGVAEPTGLSVISHNECVVVGDGVLGFGING